MNIQFLQVTDSGLAYMVIGGFVVAFSLVSLLVKEKLYINEVVLGTAIGVIFGPHCADVFNPRAWGGDLNTITLEVMRITLAVGLFAIGIELPKSYLAEHAKGLLVMVVPTMAFGWLVVAAIIYVVFPPLNFISSLVIAACLTPTDPIISAAIVGGKFATKHVPLSLRRILSAESAANDGLAYPFLSISIYLTIEKSTRVAFANWFLVGWLYQVILGTVIGSLLGLAFSYLMKLSQRKGYIDRQSYVAQYLALALFTIGVTRTLGSDDLLAAFAAGSALSWDGHFNVQTEDEVFSSVIDLALNCGTFVYIGAWMPFSLFNAPDLGLTPWRLVIVFIAVLSLRRIPPLLLLYRWVPEISSWREALFSGHFGPMGVGAIFISTLAVTELPTPHSPPEGQAEILAATLQAIVSFVVLGSIIIHGLSIPFLSFGRNVHSRTVSISRTWTSRNANPPDWLLWARRTQSAEATLPNTPTVEGNDVEQGMQQVHSAASTVSIDTARQGDKSDHVPELGPAAMISDATATAADAKTDVASSMKPRPLALGSPPPQSTFQGGAGHVSTERVRSPSPGSPLAPDTDAPYGERSRPSSASRVGAHASSEKADVKLKPAPASHAAAGTHAAGALPPPFGCEGEDEGAGEEGATTRSPSASRSEAERVVRFPVGDVRVPSDLQSPTSGSGSGVIKTVRFPEDVSGATTAAIAGVDVSVDDDRRGAGVPVGDAVGGGDRVPELREGPDVLEGNVRRPSAQ